MSEIPGTSQKVDCSTPKSKITYLLLIPFDSASKVTRYFKGKIYKISKKFSFFLFEKNYLTSNQPTFGLELKIVIDLIE